MLAGCNSILGLGDVRPRPEDAKLFLDAPPPVCTSPLAEYDAFDEPTGTTPCATWGYVQNNMCTTTVANSELVMTPDADVSTQATGCGCGAITAMGFAANTGTFAEVSAVGTGPYEFTQFYAHWEGMPSTSAIAFGGGMLSYSRDGMVFGQVAYDASSRWWRIRPTVARDAIVGEVSADGVHWSQFGLDAVTPPDQIRTEVIMGTFAAESAPTTATVEGINVCP